MTDISTQTVSAYLRDAIALAYSEAKDDQLKVEFKAHSVRHVATTLSALRYFSMDDVLKAGAWTTPDVFLSFYVQDALVDSMTNLMKLGGFVAAGVII